MLLAGRVQQLGSRRGGTKSMQITLSGRAGKVSLYKFTYNLTLSCAPSFNYWGHSMCMENGDGVSALLCPFLKLNSIHLPPLHLGQGWFYLPSRYSTTVSKTQSQHKYGLACCASVRVCVCARSSWHVCPLSLLSSPLALVLALALILSSCSDLPSCSCSDSDTLPTPPFDFLTCDARAPTGAFFACFLPYTLCVEYATSGHS